MAKIIFTKKRGQQDLYSLSDPSLPGSSAYTHTHTPHSTPVSPPELIAAQTAAAPRQLEADPKWPAAQQPTQTGRQPKERARQQLDQLTAGAPTTQNSHVAKNRNATVS